MTNATADQYVGRNAVDEQGNKIGSVGQVYLDDQTGQPDWITINTGLFGMKENFAPLAGSRFSGQDLVLPFGKDVVKDSPDIADASHLDVDEQEALYSYYRQYLGDTAGTTTAGYQLSAGRNGDQRGEGYDTSGPTADDAMTRSEEQLRVGTEHVETGRARLRKYVVTEQQSVRAAPRTRSVWSRAMLAGFTFSPRALTSSLSSLRVRSMCRRIWSGSVVTGRPS